MGIFEWLKKMTNRLDLLTPFIYLVFLAVVIFALIGIHAVSTGYFDNSVDISMSKCCNACMDETNKLGSKL